jgi:penicillin-binding protein 1A
LDKAKARQKLVLISMVDAGYINDTVSAQAYETPLNLAKSQTDTTKYGFYTDAVIEEAIQVLKGVKGYDDPEKAIYESGLKIYTPLNAPLQAYAEDYFKSASNFPSSNVKGQKIQSGMAIVDNSNGAIKAIMGGREYLQQRGFNRATDAYRQPGSSIKPLTVYSPALEAGYMPFMVLNDAPISYKTSSGVWEPKNYDGYYRGPITMRTAVEYSINTYAVQTEDLVGIQHGFDMGKSLGLDLVDSPGKNDLNLASLALGGLTKGATPVQMAAAYCAFGNTGLYNQPHFITKIVDSNGVTVFQFKPDSQRVMSEQTSWLMNNMLQTVVNSGTGTNAKVPGVPTAGKTGTSENLTDAWFCGVTPLYSGAIWMGYDDQKYKMSNVAGGGAPALMFKAMMENIYQGIKPGNWTMPADIDQVSVCSLSGKLPSPYCPPELVISEFCRQGDEPTATCDLHQSAPPVAITSPGSSYTVKICTDPRHKGVLCLANIAGPNQSGGCPAQYVQEVILQTGEQLPACSLPDHQIKIKK